MQAKGKAPSLIGFLILRIEKLFRLLLLFPFFKILPNFWLSYLIRTVLIQTYYPIHYAIKLFGLAKGPLLTCDCLVFNRSRGLNISACILQCLRASCLLCVWCLSRRCWWHAEGIKVPGGNLTNIHAINLIFMFTAHRSSVFIIPLDHHDTDIYLFKKFVFVYNVYFRCYFEFSTKIL